MHHLAVIGNPIEHSLSPTIFQLFAKQANLVLQYDKILAINENEFRLKIADFFAYGGLSINITSPFKNLAYDVASKHTMRADFCQAANFIRFENGLLVADTTDGIGLVYDVTYNKQFQLTGKKILILGSGFVLDSILLDMIVHNPSQISILARNSHRIDILAKKFGVDVFNPEISYDIVFNSTPNTEDNHLFSQLRFLSDGALCYDLTYNKESIFLQHMKQINNSIHAHNGLGMLVEQARVAFTRLFNYNPDTSLVFSQLASLGYR